MGKTDADDRKYKNHGDSSNFTKDFNSSCQVIFRTGSFVYELVRNWAKWPSDMENRAVCGIACTGEGNVIAATRSKKYPICILNGEGNLIKTIGGDLDFARTHGVTVESDGTIWCCDDQNSVVYHLSMDGEVIGQMGEKGVFSDSGYDASVRWPHDLYTNKRAAEPFNRPTRMACSPWGDYYCSDGYGNTAVHRFDREGRLLRTWGGPGREPGKFRLPHSLAFDDRERVWVCDRENFRIQVFDKEGNYLAGRERTGYASELCWYEGHMYLCDGDGQVRIYDRELWQTAVIGYPGCFARIHSIGMDGKGNIYLGRIEGDDSLFLLKNISR